MTWLFPFFLTAVWPKMRRNRMGIRSFSQQCHANWVTWTCPKSMSCAGMENKRNLDKWRGTIMGFAVDLDYTATKSSHEMRWNFHESPYHIFNRDNTYNFSLLINNNIIQILMEIPWNSRTQIHGSLAQIQTKFHAYSMSFIHVLFMYHAETRHVGAELTFLEVKLRFYVENLFQAILRMFCGK